MNENVKPTELLGALIIMLAGAAVAVLLLLAVVYLGAWFAHVLTDIARSGWGSK